MFVLCFFLISDPNQDLFPDFADFPCLINDDDDDDDDDDYL